MSRSSRRFILGGLAAMNVAVGLFLRYSDERPRVRLKAGGEFRVYKIAYGGHDVHHLPGSPRMLISAWTFLPKGVQRHIPRPREGSRGLSPLEDKKVLSIFWAWIDPATGKPTVSPSGPVAMTSDDGEVEILDTAYPFDADEGGSYRQIYIDDPPTDSRSLRFCVPVEDETADFSIRNPAYRK